MLTYQTAGESHGLGILALVNGFPAGVPIDTNVIDGELRRRQGGYGRGGRQAIESDHVKVQTGILHGQSTGAPIGLWVVNRDYKIELMPELYQPRPGHGDLSGSLKYFTGIRAILERASARETAGRVAAGALASLLLRPFKIEAVGYVLSVGPCQLDNASPEPTSARELRESRDSSALYGRSDRGDEEAIRLINQCREEGDTLGGVVEVRVFGVPFGLGSHTQWDRKLDGRLAQAVMSVQGFKGVEIGLGFESAARPGSQVHDPIEFQPETSAPTFGYTRPSNAAGGIEAGMTNGQTIIVRAAMKPIATLTKGVASIDLRTGKPALSCYERSDVCAISAASVVLEHVVAFEIATALVEKFGGDSLSEMLDRYALYVQAVQKRQHNHWS
ncbi:MAG: chorismate synthase [Planctomycetia bacterium]|nr:chorismate synthase [Planctomycetia bacterium]